MHVREFLKWHAKLENIHSKSQTSMLARLLRTDSSLFDAHYSFFLASDLTFCGTLKVHTRDLNETIMCKKAFIQDIPRNNFSLLAI